MKCTLCQHKLNVEEIAANPELTAADPLCQSCWLAWQEHLAHEDELQWSYVEARAKRVAQQQKEYDGWRQERFEQRLAEQQEAQRRADEWREARMV